MDEVFNAGIATKVFLEGDGRTRLDLSRQYGTGGKMQGKKFMICATWNAPSEAFDNPQWRIIRRQGNGGLLSPHHVQLQVHGYDMLPDYGVFDIFKNTEASPRVRRLQAAFGETLPVILNFVSWRT